MALGMHFMFGISNAIRELEENPKQYMEYRRWLNIVSGNSIADGVKCKLIRITKTVQNGHPDIWRCFIQDNEEPEPGQTFYQVVNWDGSICDVIERIQTYLEENL